MANEIIDGEIVEEKREKGGAEDVKIYENAEENKKESEEESDEESSGGSSDFLSDIIEGELIDSRWFLSTINGDFDYLKNNAKNNVGTSDNNGYTALMYAADGGRLDCVEFLCGFEEELRKQDNDGNTALIYATKRGYADVVKVLVKFEGGIKNKENKTALDYAKENEDEECIKILQDVEGDKNKENKKNKEKDSKKVDGDREKEDIENKLKEENQTLKTELKRVERASEEISKVAEIEKTELGEMEGANSELERPIERENMI